MPDRVTVDGSEVLIYPFGKKEGKIPTGSRKRFKNAEIRTHCSNCLQKSSLHYSDAFPGRISYVCDKCEHTNIIVNDKQDRSTTTVDVKTVVNSISERVNDRETKIAAIRYKNTRPEDAERLASEYQNSKPTADLVLVGGIISSCTLIMASLFSSTASLVGSLFLLLLSISMLVGSIGLHSRLRPRLPDDTANLQ